MHTIIRKIENFFRYIYFVFNAQAIISDITAILIANYKRDTLIMACHKYLNKEVVETEEEKTIMHFLQKYENATARFIVERVCTEIIEYYKGGE